MIEAPVFILGPEVDQQSGGLRERGDIDYPERVSTKDYVVP
jgi:hypothetical protein